MKFFKPEHLKREFSILSFCAAVVIATAMWYYVSVRGRIEAQVDVNINYHDIPSNLIVTKGLVNKITVRLKGPETLLRSLPREKQTEAVSLASIKKGVTIVPLPTELLSPSLRAFEIVDIQPPRIVVTADTLVDRTVPVRAIVDSPLRGGALTVENLTISPATVNLRGPEDALASISSLPLTIPLDPKAAGTTVEESMLLDTPSLVTSSPSSVQVRYTITSGRTVLTRNVKITIAHDSTHIYVVEPKEVKLRVEVPDALAKSASYLNRLEADVVAPPLEIGESKKVKVSVRLPDGMSLLSPIQEEVLVTRTKK